MHTDYPVWAKRIGAVVPNTNNNLETWSKRTFEWTTSLDHVSAAKRFAHTIPDLFHKRRPFLLLCKQNLCHDPWAMVSRAWPVVVHSKTLLHIFVRLYKMCDWFSRLFCIDHDPVCCSFRLFFFCCCVFCVFAVVFASLFVSLTAGRKYSPTNTHACIRPESLVESSLTGIRKYTSRKAGVCVDVDGRKVGWAEQKWTTTGSRVRGAHLSPSMDWCRCWCWCCCRWWWWCRWKLERTIILPLAPRIHIRIHI